MSQETLYSPMLVKDDDKQFTVDPVTREIIGEKQVLVQNDHQSERFTFVVPRFIEKRDIGQCNVVQIYYLNAKKGASATGIYTVDDMEVYPFINDKLKFTWLISQNATKHAGNLTFMIRFANIDDEGKVHYAWSTHTFSDVAVVESVEAEASFENEYVDVIEQWKSTVMRELTEYADAMISERTDEHFTELADAVLKNLEEYSDAAIGQIVDARAAELTNTVKQELTEHIGEAIVESTEERFTELTDTVVSNKAELDETKANVTDVYTKTEILSPVTKTALGLSEDAVPNDAFEKLSEINLHWWKRRVEEIGYSLEKSNEGMVAFEGTAADNYQVYFTYFDSVSVDAVTGEITISTPTTYYNAYSNPSQFSILANKYFVYGKEYSSDKTIYYTANASATEYFDGSIAWLNINCCECVVAAHTTAGECEYVSSPDRNAYPDSGTEGIFSYQYLAVPFENAREGAKIVTGSYVGTGTYGKDNVMSLTFDFAPKMVIMMGSKHNTDNTYSALFGRDTDSNSNYYLYVMSADSLTTTYTKSAGFSNAVSNYGAKSVDGRTFYWYCDNSSASYQFNHESYTYYYLAIG